MSALRRLVATTVLLGALLPSSPSHAADVTVSAAASLRDAFTEIARMAPIFSAIRPNTQAAAKARN